MKIASRSRPAPAPGRRPAARVRCLSPGDGAAWDEFVAARPDGSIHQSADYAEVYAVAGWRSEILLLQAGDCIRGGALISWKPVPLLGRALARIENGFLLADPEDQADAARLWSGILDWCAGRRAGLLEVRPHLPRSVGGRQDPAGRRLDAWMLERGGIRQPRPGGGTYWLDLGRTEGKIFRGLGPHFRRQVRRAQRAGTRVRFTFAPAVVDRLFDYYMSMQRRKAQQVSYPPAFFDRGVRHLLRRRRCVVAHTETGGVAGAFALIGLPGVPRYLLGASIPVGPDGKAVPAAGHLLHWEVACWLKGRGCATYDLGGAPGPVPQPGHPNFGVWRFKNDMRGAYVDYVGSYDFPFSAPFRLALRRGLPLYRKLTGRAS